MSYFFRNGNNFTVADENAVDMHEKLPVGNYIIKKDPMSGALFLQMIEQFKPIGKLYGTTTKDATRIINTYLSRPASTGVLLTGEKGSGKTLLAKTLSIECAKLDIPTIVINEAWEGDAFNKLVQDISQECVILFDEFEKVYDEEEQESILTLLDGVYPSKKLFVLTCNDKWRIDSHMRNRPGRIFYSLDFVGLESAFIAEYCEDNLNDKSEIPNVIRVGAMFTQFNFDMLKALVEEMNRYNEPAKLALRMLNAKPEFSADSEFKISVSENGRPMPESWLTNSRTWDGNPLSMERLTVHIQRPVKSSSSPEPALDECWADEADDNEGYFRLTVRGDEMVAMLPQEGKFIFRTSDGKYEVTLTRVIKSAPFHWDAF
jgi:hypothetical protein